MWQRLLFLSIFCLTTLTNGQQQPIDPPPMIINFSKGDFIGPEQVNYRSDDALILPCGATGNNKKWTWKHNGTSITPVPGGQFVISHTGTLFGSMLRSTESGDYQCFVEDTKTKKVTFSRKVKVAVTVVGKFINAVDVVKDIDLGQEFSFACPPHDPSYGVSFSWQGKTGTSDIQFKRDERVAISPTTGDLFIMFVIQKDIDDIAEFHNKGIRCTISGANAFQRSGLLQLTKKTADQIDPKTKKAPSWRYSAMSEALEIAVEGRNKTLYCLAVGRPVPKIIWKKNGVRLVPGKDSYEIANAFQGRLLNIVNVNQNKHEDFYTCEAENTESRGIPLVHSINLVVKVPPKWTGDSPKDKKTIEINGNGTITCNVFGIPKPSITWYKDGGRINPTARNNLKVDNNKLHFKDTDLDDNGVYQCVAENIYGMIVSSTWVQILAIRPSFENGFGPFYLFNETEGRLKCSPKAAPPPSEFIWSKDGKELKTSPYRVEPDGTLVINKVVPERDQGTYKCYAKNILGSASATAFATVLARTKIIIAPQNKTVEEGMRVDLRCEAEYDKTLELVYCWKKDKALIRCQKDDVVLTLPHITVDDAGIYTCVASTPQPKKSEDSASAIINIAGVPYPPSSLKMTDCFNRTITLSWITGAANDASITHFLIEQESTYEPNVFRVIYNVTNPNATSVFLNLTGWATLRFRVRSVNRFGPSRASIHTEYCVTDVGKPDKYPDDFRGVPKKAEELDIAWTAMPKVDWNAPGLYYKLKYRSLPNGAFVTEKLPDPNVDVFAIPNPGYYKPWEFQIQAGNDIGLGPKSPIVKSFSGQDPPAGRPEDVIVGAVGARSVELSWKPVTVTRGSVDGYRIYYWGESRIKAKRRRRAIPSNATPVNVPGGSTQTHTVTGLTPYTNYNMAIVAQNSGGEGPPSGEVFAPTDEAEPGPPSNVQVFAFAKYILVTWEAPIEPNGIITNYRVGSEVYIGSQPTDDLAVAMQEVGQNIFRKLLEDQTPEKNYVVDIQAQTSVGWGDQVRKTTITVEFAPPAKPEIPTVIGTAVDAVEVTYNFGLGGGYTHEFLVMYRRQVEGEEFQNTTWVNHFDTQTFEIGDLSPELYEFMTVGRNDYPGTSESPVSDITEARPLPGVVNAGQRGTTPIHKAAWFIALLVLIAILLIVLLVFIAYTRHQGAKYPVGKREKKRAALIDREPYDEEEGAFSNAGRTENPPPYQSEGSLQKSPDSDRDSLDDYGEGPQFNEDGSFIAEYGDEKKPAPDEKDESAFATFV